MGLLITIVLAVVIFIAQELSSKAQIKKLTKLIESLKKDTKEFASEALKATEIPEMIDARIENGIKKELSAVDKMVTTLVAQKLDKIDKRFKKPVGDPSDYVKLGDAACLEGNYKMAIGHYDKVIELNPNSSVAWWGKGFALHKLGQDDPAIKAFGKAIKLKPDAAIVWYFKARVYFGKGDKRNALENLSKAIELDAIWKEIAKENEDFKNLWDDEDFKRITE